jgi:hypothetical protein
MINDGIRIGDITIFISWFLITEPDQQVNILNLITLLIHLKLLQDKNFLPLIKGKLILIDTNNSLNRLVRKLLRIINNLHIGETCEEINVLDPDAVVLAG